jgi:CTP synthase (UTP-ammonia lyase)
VEDIAVSTIRIALIGDNSPQVRAHVAIPQALELAARVAGCRVAPSWIATPLLEHGTEQLSVFDGIWCVPGSPYASMEGALNAIRFAREEGIPLLGTCGGFQHALIEYARNVLGLAEADHAESNAAAAMPLIAPLACSLVGTEGTIALQPGSRISAVYGRDETVEQYHCSYGLNPRYLPVLDAGPLRVTGKDANGEVRVVEMGRHPFFIATLYQPELSALAGVTHPLVTAYVQAIMVRSRTGTALPATQP